MKDGSAVWVTSQCEPGRACPPDVLHQPGLIQALAARKHAQWTLRSEALLLWRNAPPSRPIYSTIVPGTDTLGPVALNANQLNSDVLAAPRISRTLLKSARALSKSPFLE